MHEYDNRYLWMNLKRIISSHFANYRESWEANRLIAKGKIHPTLSRAYPLDDVGQAALDVHHNPHQGKVGVLCLAPEEGLASATRSCAPRTRPRSTGSAASEPADSATDSLRRPGVRSQRGSAIMVPVAQPQPRTRNSPMTDQGLSIFDDEPDDVDAPRTAQSAPSSPSRRASRRPR